jgi:DNA-binding CsgD family transcriptional regulator/PAS domain-containing protein
MNAAQSHELIRRLYDWATGSNESDFPRRLTEAVACRNAAIIYLQTDTGHFVVEASHGHEPETLSSLVQRHLDRGRYNAALNPTLSGRFLDLVEFVKVAREQALSSDAFDPPNGHPNVGIGVAMNDGQRSYLLLVEKDSPFEKRDERIIESLLPHISTAMSARARILDGEKRFTSLQSLLQHSPFGFLLFDADGNELYRNDTVDQILETDGSLINDVTPLIKINRRGLAELDKTIHEQVKESHAAGESMLRLPAVNKESGSHCLLRFRKFHDVSGIDTLTGRSTIAVMIHDPTVIHEVRVRDIQSLYRLTPAEAQVCKLLYDGHSIDTVSRQLGVTAHTTKAHLSHSFKKVGVHTQAALLKKLSFSIR